MKLVYIYIYIYWSSVGKYNSDETAVLVVLLTEGVFSTPVIGEIRNVAQDDEIYGRLQEQLAAMESFWWKKTCFIWLWMERSPQKKNYTLTSENRSYRSFMSIGVRYSTRKQHEYPKQMLGVGAHFQHNTVEVPHLGETVTGFASVGDSVGCLFNKGPWWWRHQLGN